MANTSTYAHVTYGNVTYVSVDFLYRVARAAVTPLIPADYLDLAAPLRGSTLRARVIAVEPETAQAVTLVLQPGRGWQGHVPGQYLRLGVDIEGVRHWRSFSITSPPGSPTLTVTVRTQGLVSAYLASVAPGAIVELDQAAGHFVIPDDCAKVLFITAGSGITPVMGILRSLALPDAVLVHSARTSDEVIFGDELRHLAIRGRIGLHEQITASGGRLRLANLGDLVPDFTQRVTLVCGPAGLIDDVLAFFEGNGLPAPRHERFHAVLPVTGEGGRADFARTGVRSQLSGSESLLQAGEDAGVLLPFGCRMGICYGCVTPLTTGSVRDLRDGSLTTADTEPVLIQTCINTAAGPCTLDA